MQNQHNTTNYLLLLQQQIHLQYDLYKYLRQVEDTFESLESINHTDRTSIKTTIENISNNLLFVISALQDAKTNNNSVIKEFRECIRLMSTLNQH